jgi:phosphatidylserine decarboxylase
VTLNNFFYDQVVSQLPKKWMSHYVGLMAHINAPKKVSKKIIKAFAQFYKIDISEIEKPLAEYDSIGEFFSRKLQRSARPIMGEIVHPCDGVLIESGKIHESVMIQAKGKSFSLEKFLPENPWLKEFKDGSFFTYYLAPHNYHRVHSPISGQILWSTLVPGELWPVNSWSVRNVDGLYVINERVVTGIETPKGKVIVVMVGATNVGSITMSYDPNIKTNSPHKKEVVHRQYSDERSLKVGDELGVFNLGSTVVVLFESKFDFSHRDRQEVKMGQKFN